MSCKSRTFIEACVHPSEEGIIIATFRSAYHTHGPQKVQHEWVTVRFLDRQDRVIRHTKADGSVWDRIHVYKRHDLNASEVERPQTIWVEGSEQKVRSATHRSRRAVRADAVSCEGSRGTSNCRRGEESSMQ